MTKDGNTYTATFKVTQETSTQDISVKLTAAVSDDATNYNAASTDKEFTIAGITPDKKGGSSSDGASGKSGESGTPKTGDESPIGAIGILFIVSAAGITGSIGLKKKLNK